eukprot:515984_1
MNRSNNLNGTSDTLCTHFLSTEVPKIQCEYNNGLYFNCNNYEETSSINKLENNNDLFWCIQCNKFNETEIIQYVMEMDNICKMCNTKDGNIWSQCTKCKLLYCFNCILSPNNYQFMNNKIQNNGKIRNESDIKNDNLKSIFISSNQTSNHIQNRKRSFDQTNNDNNSLYNYTVSPSKRRKLNYV